MTDKEIFLEYIKKTKGENSFDYEYFEKQNEEYFLQPSNTYPFIFSHSFAKSFWGEEEICYHCHTVHNVAMYDYDSCTVMFKHTRKRNILTWQYHLQQMVLEEDPLKYLKRFL